MRKQKIKENPLDKMKRQLDEKIQTEVSSTELPGELSVEESTSEAKTSSPEEKYGEVYFNKMYEQTGIDPKKKTLWQQMFAFFLDKMFLLHMPDGGKKKVLELGCAFGNVVEALNERKIYTEGVDVSSYAIQKTPYKTNVLHNTEAWNLRDIKDESFDFVFGMHLLNHIPKDKMVKTFSEISRVLVSGGVVFMTFEMGSEIIKQNDLETIYPKYFVDECATKFALVDESRQNYDRFFKIMVPAWDFMRKYRWDYVIYRKK